MKALDNLDNLAAVLVLGLIGGASVFHAVPETSVEIAKLIAVGIVGYLAKAANSPS